MLLIFKKNIALSEVSHVCGVLRLRNKTTVLGAMRHSVSVTRIILNCAELFSTERATPGSLRTTHHKKHSHKPMERSAHYQQ
jgi:hypothetical protein